MKIVLLPEVATIIMGQSPPSTSYNARGEGLPFFQGKADFGDLYPSIRMFCTAPNKIAEAGDILISVRAPVGPTNIAPVKCCIGRGLAAIRSSKNIEAQYLLYFLRFYEPKLLESGTGSTFDAVSRNDLEAIQFPLPPLDQQKRIAAILSKADRLRRMRRYARELSDGYLQSVFLEMFDDPVLNPREWKRARVAELGKVQTGNTPSRDEPENYGDFIEWIKSDNITNDEMFVAISREMLSEIGLEKGRFVEPGSILVVCIAGSPTTIGNVALTNRKVAFNQQINAVTPNKDVDSIFLYGLFRLAKPLVQRSTTLGMKRIITKSKFEELFLIKPPLPLQQKFAQIVQKTERLRAQQRESERQAEHLFQSLLHRAFRGEL